MMKGCPWVYLLMRHGEQDPDDLVQKIAVPVDALSLPSLGRHAECSSVEVIETCSDQPEMRRRAELVRRNDCTAL